MTSIADANITQNTSPFLFTPLINRELRGNELGILREKVFSLPQIALTSRELSDLEMIAIGGYSPLEGFMTKQQYNHVLDHMRLPQGQAWTIPITLAVSNEQADTFKIGSDIALTDDAGEIYGVLHLEEKFTYDKAKEALKVFGTDDENHPGVLYTQNKKEVYVGGKISLLRRLPVGDPIFKKFQKDPVELFNYFRQKGWKRVVAFQTRNPPHRGHEYIQKCGLEVSDGLLLHPLVGETKSGDINAIVRMKCYEVLFEKYYPADRVALSILPAPMHYAGPREAVHHAIMRRNYGCTHFIVGRDHAGVGNYYGTFDAHYIFNEYSIERELGIQPLFFDHAFFCSACSNMTSYKTCPHDAENHVILSGTKVRQMLKEGKRPPYEFMRPEIADLLVEAMREEIAFVI
ncbi:MAG: sulfate adenylyltransferase [bacterium]